METKIEEEWARIIPQTSINITNAKKLRDEFKEIMNQGINKFILDLKMLMMLIVWLLVKYLW